MFPVQQTAPERVKVAFDNDELTSLLTSNAYSFSIWSLYDIRQVDPISHSHFLFGYRYGQSDLFSWSARRLRRWVWLR
jgi:hypothetical protein